MAMLSFEGIVKRDTITRWLTGDRLFVHLLQKHTQKRTSAKKKTSTTQCSFHESRPFH